MFFVFPVFLNLSKKILLIELFLDLLSFDSTESASSSNLVEILISSELLSNNLMSFSDFEVFLIHHL